MNHSKTLKIIAIGLFVIGIFGLILYWAKGRDEDKATPSTSNEPAFAWEYTFLAEDDLQATVISLTATYPNKEKVTKRVDLIEAKCDEYASPDADVYAKSTMILCYSAGLGHYYKVVSSTTGYAVMRKRFEEAGPDYNPPQLPYETVVRF